jgi:hypothetical protein
VTRHNKCFAVYRQIDRRVLNVGFGNSLNEAVNNANKNCSENGKYYCIPDNDKSSDCDNW